MFEPLSGSGSFVRSAAEIGRVPEMKADYINLSEKAFHAFREHTHPSWELLLIVEGTGIERIDGRDYACGKGDIFCIPPGVPHSSRSEEGIRDFSVGLLDFVPVKSGGLIILQDDEDGNVYHLLRGSSRTRCVRRCIRCWSRFRKRSWSRTGP